MLYIWPKTSRAWIFIVLKCVLGFTFWLNSEEVWWWFLYTDAISIFVLQNTKCKRIYFIDLVCFIVSFNLGKFSAKGKKNLIWIFEWFHITLKIMKNEKCLPLTFQKKNPLKIALCKYFFKVSLSFCVFFM